MKHFDLTTEADILFANKKLNTSALKELEQISSYFQNEMMRVKVFRHCISIYLKKDGKYMFASEVTLSQNSEGVYGINFGSCGRFIPKDENYDAAYYRTLNAAEILRHWDKVIIWAEKWVVKKVALNTQIFALNPPISKPCNNETKKQIGKN